MQRFRDMPINRKLTLVIVLTCSGVLLAAGTATIATQIVTSTRQMAARTRMITELLARNSSAALAFHRDEDVEEINKTLSALDADPHIILACVYDRAGNQFGAYRHADVDKGLPRHPPADGQRFSIDQIEVSGPIMLDQQRIGTILVRSDLGEIYQQAWLHAAVVALILLAIIVTTLALSPHLRRPIAEPVLELAEVARRVARNRDYSARATKRSEDEIGLLTDAFNQMLGEIGAAQSSLQHANADLAAARDAAEAASRAKDQFLAVLSHELRTPLTPVLLTVALLERHPQLPADLQDDVKMIHRHVQLEARLIDDLLDLTRITRGKLQLSFEITDVHVLLRDAINICCAERLKDVTLSLQAREHHVRADPARLLQIFWNLLNNAMKFTPPGQPVVVRSSSASGKIRVEVIDSGVGIEPDVLPKIFNAFEQGESSATRSFGGLGLGLTIAKALAQVQGGDLTADSEGRGRGARFTIEIPTVRAPAPKPSAPEPLPEPAGRGGDGNGRARPLRVLLVEDHPDTLGLMTKLLRTLGHDVETAASVQQALSVAQNQSIDLVISDLGLPDGSGLDLMRQLRDKFHLKGICLSGFGMEEDVARSAEAGFSRHLTKPVDVAKLQHAIQDVSE